MSVFENNGISISYDVIGAGPPVLLLHGFPQTRAMWRPVAPVLAERFTVVTADLRGYGASSKPAPEADLSNCSFRAMGEDMFALMSALGHDRFHLVGHDRGGRTAYRMARDRSGRITTLTVMDIVPTDFLVDTWDYPVSKAYFHWSYLAQPAPFPEHMIGADPDHFFEACMLGWGGASVADFREIETYRAAWRDPETISGMCNDYRAGVTVDVAHDRADAGQTVECRALVLYGAEGVMAQSYDIARVWAERMSRMTCKALPGGHFFVDQYPAETADALLAFLSSAEG